MTTSGSVDFSLVQTEIIHDAMTIAGVLAAGESAAGEDYEHVQRLLNALVKNLFGPRETIQSRGLKLWARKRGTVFLQDSQSKYSLGASGDHASVSCVNTTLSAAEAAGQTSLSVTSITGISDGDYIGIVLDNNTVHWSTVNGTPSAGVVAIDDALASAAASGNRVYTYTTIIQRPVEILSVLLRDDDGNDTPLERINLGQYEDISKKTSEVDPTRYYPEAQVDSFDIYLDGYPKDTSKTLEIVFLRPFEDFDTTTDTPDYPQEWYEPLLYNLAVRVCVAFARPVPQELASLAASSLQQANSFYPETSTLYFEPDRPY